MEDFYISIPVAKDNKTAPNFLKTTGYYPSTTECSMVINTDNIVEKPSSFDCSIDFKKTENEEIYQDQLHSNLYISVLHRSYPAYSDR